MKLSKKLLFGIMAAVALVGCKDDPVLGPESPVTPDYNGPGVYFTLQIDLPNAAGSRSETDEPGANGSTSSGGVEIGKDYENGVAEAIIVLANAEEVEGKAAVNGYIAAAPINSGNLTALNQAKSSYVAKSKFSKAQLNNFYTLIGKEDATPLKANIFVFCNPTQNLRAVLLGGTYIDADDSDDSDDADKNKLKDAPAQGSNDWLQEVGKIGVPGSTAQTSSIWSKNAFLMSNALIATRELPGNIEQWNLFTTEDNPFHLSQANTNVPGIEGGIDNATDRGAVKVERACARFDFRDGSEKGDFMYDVLFMEDNGIVTENPLIQVQLQKMFLVNQSNSFYYLPRTVAPVSDNGGSIVGVTVEQLKAGVCKPEKPWTGNGTGGYTTPWGNYVADYNIGWKNEVYELWTGAKGEGDKEDEDPETGGGSTTISSNFSAYFNYPFFNNDGTIDNTDIVGNRWSMYLCKDVVTNGEDQNTEGWTPGPTVTKNNYKIWCYSTENTIPSIEGQINGISTGVVFKAKYSSPYKYTEADLTSGDLIKRNYAMIAKAVNNEEKVDAQDPVLYMFSKVLYCGWENVREAALEAADAQFTFIKIGEKDDVDADGKPIKVPDGHWELRSINRSNSLYKAVFGEGGVGTLTFT